MASDWKWSEHTLLADLHGTNNATPGIHNTLTERDNVVEHLVRALRRSSHSGSLLQNLGNHGQVGLEVASNGTSNVTKALQDSRLELVGKSGALQFVSKENGSYLSGRNLP